MIETSNFDNNFSSELQRMVYGQVARQLSRPKSCRQELSHIAQNFSPVARNLSHLVPRTNGGERVNSHEVW